MTQAHGHAELLAPRAGTRIIATFPRMSEFLEAKGRLDAEGLTYEVVSPDSGYSLVGVPCLVIDSETRRKTVARYGSDFTCSGWIDYRPATIAVPKTEPVVFQEDIFGRATVMLLAPCMADAAKIRLIAHLSGDLAEVFPYMNTEIRQGSYNPKTPSFTFMIGYRMIALYPRRVVVAKADEMVDGWRVLEEIRQKANDLWSRRSSIEPSYETREKPPAVEIYKRLPRTNCKTCGEKTCLAFAVRVHGGEMPVSLCKPVFGGDAAYLKDALLEICAAFGIEDQ